MLHPNKHVPLLNIPSAIPDGHRPKVLAKMDRQVLPLSKVQNHLDLSYMLNLHLQLIADHLISDLKELGMTLICELQDKHRHSQVHTHFH